MRGKEKEPEHDHARSHKRTFNLTHLTQCERCLHTSKQMQGTKKGCTKRKIIVIYKHAYICFYEMKEEATKKTEPNETKPSQIQEIKYIELIIL